MKFWDTSALVPLLVEEGRSQTIRGLLKEDPSRVIWWASPVELFSALQRASSSGRFPSGDQLTLKGSVEVLFREVDTVTPTRMLRDRAIRLVSVHSLKVSDALQLASALTWAEERPQGRGFVSLDERLRPAAFAEGFTILPQRGSPD